MIETLRYIRERLFETLGKAKVMIGGTITTVSPDDLYPTFIANEGLGGLHIYANLAELGAIPVSRLQKGMQAVVNEHTNSSGETIPRTIYILENLPTETVDRISDIPGYDISTYWKVFEAVSDYEGALETEYAPYVDKLTGVAVLSGGGVPSFPGSRSGRKVTRAQYDSLVVGTDVTFDDGVDPLIVSGYWSKTYDSTKGHAFMRSRVGRNANWSNPVKIAGEGYESGDYIANIFKWSATQPVTPSQFVNGKPNNNPDGWTDGPAANPNDGSKLWMSKAQKDVYQQIKTPWTPPIEIKIDGTLVRYSEKATPNPNDFGSDYVALASAGWEEMYNPNTHRYMARRETTTSQWVVDILAGESGEYLEYVFKQFDSHLVDDILLYPSNYRPKDTLATGWEDTPITAVEGKTTFVSAALKFSNGELKTNWSDPTPFGGRDVIFPYIKSHGGDEFKKNKDGLITPSSIKLEAMLYKGVNKVTPTSIEWVEIYDGGNPGTTIMSTTNELVLSPSDVVGHAIYQCKQIYENKEFISEYSILDIADGIDAKNLDTTANSYIVTIKNDGSRSPSSLTVRALHSNLTGVIHWYKNGTKILNADATPYSGDSYAVTLTDFNDGTEITYKAEAQSDFLADGVTKLSDETTIYGVAEASGGAPANTMILTNESHTVVLDEETGTTDFSTAKTTVKVYEGATDVTSTWTVAIAANTNVTSTIDNTTASAPLITVTGMNSGVSAGSVTIRATKDTNTLSKQFSISRINDPIGAIILDIDSDKAGFSFSPTEQRTKTLTANLYIDGTLKTTGVTYAWTFDGVSVGTARTKSISPADVEYMTTVRCVATYNTKSYGRTVNVNDVKDARGFGVMYSTSTEDLSSSDKPGDNVAYNNTTNITVGTVTWTINSTDAIWMVTRKEGDVSWSDPIRIKGEQGIPGSPGTPGAKGNFMKNIFKNATSKPAKPTGHPIPTGWTDVPTTPAAGEYVFMSQGEVDPNDPLYPNGKLIGAWSEPVQFNGMDGVQGPPGNPGPTGATGEQGPTGPAGVSHQVFVQSSQPSSPRSGAIWIKI